MSWVANVLRGFVMGLAADVCGLAHDFDLVRVLEEPHLVKDRARVEDLIHWQNAATALEPEPLLDFVELSLKSPNPSEEHLVATISNFVWA